MSETQKKESLKDVVLREDAASEEVKQNDIAALRRRIEENRNEINRLNAILHKKKNTIICLSIFLGVFAVGFAVLLAKDYMSEASFFSNEDSAVTQTATETASEEDQVQKLADNNDAEAQFTVGERYFSGLDGYRTDKQQALEWFHRSANNGNIAAMKKLAAMYESGDGVEKNNKSAFKYYFTAAGAGDSEALYKTGKFYYYGIGVDKNTEKALFYTNKAAADNYQPAKALLEIIRQDNAEEENKTVVKSATETSTTAGKE